MKKKIAQQLLKHSIGLRRVTRSLLDKTNIHKGVQPDEILLFRSILNDTPVILIFAFSYMAVTLFIFTWKEGLLFQDSMYIYIRLLMGLTALVLCFWLAYRKYNVRYQISLLGIKALRGILSNHQVDAKLEYYQIRGIEIHRSFFQRIIGTGDLHVHGSTSNEAEVAFIGIAEPYKYEKLIQSRQRKEITIPLEPHPKSPR